MKDFKLLLAGLILLLLLIFAGVFMWLWISNSNNTHPLPILIYETAQETIEEDSDKVKNNIDANSLYIQAQQPLQAPLDDVIASFEARYSQMQVLTNYVPATALLILDNTNATDMVLADDQLSDSLLALLQDELNSNVKNNIMNPPIPSETSSNTTAEKMVDNNEVRTLNPFGYAMRESHLVEGVILSDKPIAINFRNFLISSTGQDILRKYKFENINGYQNSVDDLFNPTSHTKNAKDGSSLVVTDALSNGN